MSYSQKLQSIPHGLSAQGASKHIAVKADLCARDLSFRITRDV